jgi:transposase
MTTNNNANQLFVGMDLHKNTSTFCVKDRDGVLIRQQKVLTDRNQITRFIRSFDRPLSLAVEPVSQWHTFADHLQGLGVDVHLAHPMRVKAIAAARIKTDTIDAGVLCDLLRSDLLPEAYFAPREVRSWKEIVRYRAGLLNLRTQVKNKIHAILHKHALKHTFSNLFGVSGTAWLKSLRLKEPFATALTEYLSLIDTLTEKIDAAEKTVEQMVTDHPQARLLTSIPGVSYVSALTIIAEIGDIHRFPAAKKLMGYAGLVPSTYASGDVVRHGRITKTGSKWLRYIMIEVAHHQQLCKKTPGFGSYYLALKQRKGTGPAAVATARKLLAVVWRLLTDNRPWQEAPPDRGNIRLRAEALSSPS